MTKKKLIFFQLQFLLPFSSSTAINNNINIDNQAARGLSIQNLSNQFKFMVFGMKIATAGDHLIFL